MLEDLTCLPHIARETSATLVWHPFFGQDRLDFVREAVAAA